MGDLDVHERETEVEEYWMFARRRVAWLEMAFQNFLMLAIQQSEEIRRARAVIDVMSTDGTLTNLDDDQVVEGLVGGVPFVA